MNYIISVFFTICMFTGGVNITFAQLNEQQAWNYTEKIDALTDVDSSFASAFQHGCLGDCASIVVRADKEVIINFNQFMNSGSPIKLEYRFDKEQVKPMQLTVSTTGVSGFIREPFIDRFVAELMHYKMLVLRGYDYEGTPVTFKINLTGAKEQISKVAAFNKAKPLITFLKEDSFARELAKSARAEVLRIANLSPEEANKEELEALRKALVSVEKVTGKNSDAYKLVKEQYEDKMKEIKSIRK